MARERRREGGGQRCVILEVIEWEQWGEKNSGGRLRLGCQREFRPQASVKQSAPREGEEEDVEAWQTAAVK